ncbi:MAG: NmrA family NAD(P)-binding protein [Pseudoclavibacter sp.]
MILVTGATGTIGQSVVSGLLESGTQFRATTRQAALVGEEPHLVRMDLGDRESFGAVLDGVATVFLNSSQHPDMASHQSDFIAAAAAAGVRHVVKVSAGSAATGPDKPSWVGRAHAAIEQRLDDSGMGWTILRPNYFMQNLLGVAPAIAAGKLPMVLDTDHRLALVDARDIAAVATVALRNPEAHRMRRYDITGDEAMSPIDIAEKLSAGLGHRVAHVPISLDELRSGAARAGAPDWLQLHLAELMQIYASNDSVGVVSNDTKNVTGRTPRALAEFIQDHERIFSQAD